jgi:hypothetical protein
VTTPMSDIRTEGFRRDQMYTRANESGAERKGFVNKGEMSCGAEERQLQDQRGLLACLLNASAGTYEKHTRAAEEQPSIVGLAAGVRALFELTRVAHSVTEDPRRSGAPVSGGGRGEAGVGSATHMKKRWRTSSTDMGPK